MREFELSVWNGIALSPGIAAFSFLVNLLIQTTSHSRLHFLGFGNAPVKCEVDGMHVVVQKIE